MSDGIDFQPAGGDGIDFQAQPSAIESAVHGVVNNVPGGPQMASGLDTLAGKMGLQVPGLAPNKPTYSENLAKNNANMAAGKAAHPVAYGAGAVTGALAPLAVPGVGEAMEAAPVATNAAIGGIDAISNKDLTKDPAGTAKAALEGGLVGGAVGKAGEVVGDAVHGAAQMGKRLEANATANALDLGTYGVRKLTKGDENPEEVLNALNEKINKLIPNFIQLSDTSASKYQKLLTAKETAGEAIGHVVDTTAEKLGGKIPEVDEAIQDLKAATLKYNGMTSQRNADARAELTDLSTRMEALQNAGKLDFRALQDLKSDLGQAYHNPNLQNHGIDQAYGILSDTMDKILDRTTIETPSLKGDFDKAKEVYKLTSTLMPAMKRGTAREVAGVGGGLTSAGLGVAAMLGHPAAAGIGYAGKTAAKLAAPDLAPNLAYRTIQAARNLPSLPAGTGQALPQEINDLVNSWIANHRKGEQP
jgi:hypothetical protein